MTSFVLRQTTGFLGKSMMILEFSREFTGVYGLHTYSCCSRQKIVNNRSSNKEKVMPRNVEIKASVEDLPAVMAKAKELSGGEGKEILQRDTFFSVPNGRLKLRYLTGQEAELIYYARGDQEGPKLSDYHIATSSVPDDLSKVLGAAIGIRGEVKKTRWLFMVGQTRVHCDKVEGLGDFAELEVVLEDDQSVEEGEAIANELMDKLGIDRSKLISCAYMDLILQGKSQ